jgi:Domain of unknown function (DUF4136)
MKRNLYIGLTLFLLSASSVLLAGAQSVNVDFDKQADFSAFKTYAWATGTPVKNPLMDQRIIDAINARLAAKGLHKVDVGADPDLIVLYHGAVGTQIQLNTTSYGWGRRYGGGMSSTSVDEIPVGELTVDIGDARTKKLLWVGDASDTLSDKSDKNEKNMNKALDKMFKKFPPPVKK